jgi:cytochrome c5
VQEQTDKAFLKNVSIVLVILVIFTFSIVFLARDLGFQEEADSSPSSIATTESRVRPVADVYTDEDDAVIAPIQAAASQAIAFDGSLDGEMIYNTVCAACHATGVTEAPIPGSAELALRAEKGMDALMQSVLNGLNIMPARGGMADLSDEQVQASVEFMLQ